MAETLTIYRAGMATVTDLGRFGWARHGVSVNGALDQYSAQVANVAVGNALNAPLIEIPVMDFVCTASTDLLISVTGAPADVTIGGRAQPQWEPAVAHRDERIVISNIRRGLRTYLAVHGSVAQQHTMGSCAPDPLIGVGHRLTDGDQLALAGESVYIDHPYSRQALFRLAAPLPDFPDRWTIDAVDGPHAAQFGESLGLLYSREYTVSPSSNHVGMRLSGETPKRQQGSELLSRGVPVGAIEKPPGDELLVLHRGRNVTAGYPVLAVATSTALSRLGQVRPGQTITFRQQTIDEAVAARRAEAVALTELHHRVKIAFGTVGIPVKTLSFTPPPSQPLASELEHQLPTRPTPD
ncbi:biotin-dependent carboxyltransferase family protein [Rhodococcus sp. NPDC057529]|uniref:5-oxoprolinase subunit C family protein n=1 Tax=Rhodococcus sp. NPDC057529 TaxID=3346158 RepID=UPI00366DE24B